MRQRSISSVGVAFVGIVPVLMGVPVLAPVLVLLALIGLSEFHNLSRPFAKEVIPTGFLAVPLFGIIAARALHEQAVIGVVAVAVGAPLVLVIFRRSLAGAFTDWSLAAAGSLYLGIPIYAAVMTRSIGGTVDAEWLRHLASWGALGWQEHPRGLAWLLTVILATWLSDTGAFLLGRSFGRHPLIPTVSPKKTMEGLAGGLISAGLTGSICVTIFGLGVSWWLGFLLGLVIGGIAVIGDLAESVLKREAGVKDSGTLIPGHGGVLDRLDALLFTWTAGWFLVTLVDRIR